MLFVLGLLTFVIVASSSQTDRSQETKSQYSPGLFQIELFPAQCDYNKPVQECDVDLKAGDDISFQLLVTNISPEAIRVPITKTFLMNRPELYRDGQLLPYREGISEKLETGIFPTTRKDFVYLAPGKRQKLESIFLKSWYGLLEAGHYQLSVKHRFPGTDESISSDPITFEVRPKRARR